ncbi:hypothetical protein FACS1894116_03200 [Betaproteobacteria bacterium]|nr:hypothetical protein FACS1894116_03200 [Betaproteobacteria bacterium]GHU07938.1 hypothetical protein AGMMS50225_05700 [Betaproteobacteria bacterium]GHU22238.1 hypothetical protein FACS189488_02390 [Betaproteobacteria bacterium]GHU27951.1 hypothetical protein FACS189497_02220 [Betaproteobacteria bacterium]
MAEVTFNPNLNAYLQGAADDQSLVASGEAVAACGRVGSFFTFADTPQALSRTLLAELFAQGWM